MKWRLLVALVMIVLPIAEILVIIQVGHLIGGWPTAGLLLLEGLVGAWLLKREGSRSWRSLKASVQAGQLPERELADTGLVLVGATLLITPGFITDVAGFFCLLPPTRPLARRLVLHLVGRRVIAAVMGPDAVPPGAGGRARAGRADRRASEASGAATADDVVTGEVIDSRVDDGTTRTD